MGQDASRLEILSESIRKGIKGGGLRRLMKPDSIMRACEVINNGDAQKVSLLMRDVVGESSSIAAGESVHGGAAVVALYEAQAICLVESRRPMDSLEFSPAADLNQANSTLKSHREALLIWADTGQYPGET